MLEKIKSYLDENKVKLVAVSKTKPHSMIQEMYDKGHRVFGENRVQELREKNEALPKDIEWHMIGSLQKNKVKELQSLENINICGLMGMGTFTNNEEITIEEFKFLSKFFEELKGKYFKDSLEFKEISMGMSGDYKLAVEHGSTMVRIGSLLFGSR